MKRLNLLLAVLLSLLGVSQMNAETLTEDFESVTLVDAFGNPLANNWSYGYGLSNGWKVIDGTIYSSAGAAPYGLVSGYGYESTHCLEASYSSSNTAYIAIPTKLCGTLSFYASGTAASVDGKIVIYELEVSGDSYTKKAGDPIATFAPTRYNNSSKAYVWEPFTVDLGTSGKVIGIEMTRSNLDNFSADIYEESAEVKAVAISAFATTTPNVKANAEGQYTATFTATVENTGTAALTAEDNVTISLLDATKNVLLTSEPIELAVGESKDVTITYTGTASADETVDFYVQENLTNVQFATAATVSVEIAGPRFSLTPEGGYDFGVVAKGSEATKSFSITNNGDATMTINAVVPEGFMAASTITVESGETAEWVISLNTEVMGMKKDTLKLTTNAIDVTTYEIPVSGYVYDSDLFFEGFSAGTLPEGWECDANGWTFVDGVAKGTYVYGETNYLTTPELTVATGDELVFMARPTASFADMKVQISKDGADFMDYWRVPFEAATEEFTIFTVTGLPVGNYRLRFLADNYELDNINGFRVKVEEAPELTVSLGETIVATGDVADFGRVAEQPEAKTYTVSNTGTGILDVTISSSDIEQFTVSETAMTLAQGESKTFDLALVFNEVYGEKTADITITPSYDPEKAIVIKATAVTADSEIWEEDFESGEIPVTWQNNGWQADVNDDANGTIMATINSRVEGTLITPRLFAEAGDKLAFETYYPWNDEALLIEYSNDNCETWNVISNYKPQDDGQPSMTTKFVEFEAPVRGYYYLRFTAKYASLDNFRGFKWGMKEHDVIITAQNIPATGEQYAEYTATVTVQELIGREEAATAVLYFDETPVASAEQVITANGEATFTLTYVPQEAAENVEASIVVTYAGGELQAEKTALTIAPAFTLDETVAPGELTAKTYPAIIVNYNAAAGWNTFSLPFPVGDVQEVFGAETKAYKFANYLFNTMMFEETTALEAGVPYILHNALDINGPVTFKNVEISEEGRTEQAVTKGSVTFQATYSPLTGILLDDKYAVVPEYGVLQNATEVGAINGLRGYFILPETVDLTRVKYTFTNLDGTVITGIDDATLTDNGEWTKAHVAIYDLQGRRHSGTVSAKGIYIQNGRKIAVK